MRWRESLPKGVERKIQRFFQASRQADRTFRDKTRGIGFGVRAQLRYTTIFLDREWTRIKSDFCFRNRSDSGKISGFGDFPRELAFCARPIRRRLQSERQQRQSHSPFAETTFTSLNRKGLSLSRKGFPLAVVTFFRMTSLVLIYGYFSTWESAVYLLLKFAKMAGPR